jgi:hypothetical protein
LLRKIRQNGDLKNLIFPPKVAEWGMLVTQPQKNIIWQRKPTSVVKAPFYTSP